MLWNVVYPVYSPDSGTRGKASQPERCVLAEVRGGETRGTHRWHRWFLKVPAAPEVRLCTHL